MKLIASDGARLDRFGISVGLSGDTAIIGAIGNDAGASDTGAAYLFDVQAGNELRKLTASDASDGDEFGNAVAIRGNTAIVGAARKDVVGTNSGAAYLFNVADGTELFRLTPSDADVGDNFGGSVAIHDARAIVGAAGNDDAGTSSGAAYIFDLATGAELFKLTSPVAQERDVFGESVAINESFAVVGSPRSWQRTSPPPPTGVAHLFDVETGSLLHTLTPIDSEEGDGFGISAAINGDHVVIGAAGNFGRAGAAYVFDAATGEQIAKITASDREFQDTFGRQVAIDESYVAVGSIGDDDRGVYTGSAYLYASDRLSPMPFTGYQETAVVGPFNTNSNIGVKVAIDREVSVVSAAFRVYAVDAATSSQIELVPDEEGFSRFGSRFGQSIAIRGSRIIVGASRDGGSGSAFLFDASTGSQLRKLTANTPSIGGDFGYAVDIQAVVALVGEPSGLNRGDEYGAAYVFDVTNGSETYRLLSSSPTSNYDRFGFGGGFGWRHGGRWGPRVRSLIRCIAAQSTYLISIPAKNCIDCLLMVLLTMHSSVILLIFMVMS